MDESYIRMHSYVGCGYEGGLAQLNFRGLLALDSGTGFYFAVYEYLNVAKL